MERTFINLAKEPSRGIDALKGTRVPAVFSDAVRVQLKDCALLFISGKVGLKDDSTLAGRTMREQTRRTLENIQVALGLKAEYEPKTDAEKVLMKYPKVVKLLADPGVKKEEDSYGEEGVVNLVLRKQVNDTLYTAIFEVNTRTERVEGKNPEAIAALQD